MNFNNDFENQIFNNSTELVSNYSELAIDAFLSDGVLKEIPIVKTLYSVYKIGNSFSNARFMRNMLSFLQKIKSMDITDEILNKYKENFSKRKNKKYFIEKTIYCLEKIEDIWKSKILGNAFLNLCNQNLSYEEYSFIVEYISSCYQFEFNIISKLTNLHSDEGKNINQLIVCGLKVDIIKSGILHLTNNGIIEEFGTVYYGKIENTEKKYGITKFGNELYENLELNKFLVNN